jgi:S1-C subfamily serine protease
MAADRTLARTRTTVIAIALATLGLGRTAVADDHPDLAGIKNAVVIVVAKGTDPTKGNISVASRGTGFFISKEGYLVTSYHLVTALGDVAPDTVSYEIHFGTGQNDAIVSAAIAWPLPQDDLLVLFASLAERDVAVLQRGDRAGINIGTTPVYSAGYPQGWQYSLTPGVITSFGLVDPIPAWATSLTFKEGQSGSPILRANRTVIAVARGNDADATSIGVVIPVRPIPREYWDSP